MISKPMIGQFVFLFVWNCLYILFRLQMWVIEHTIFVLKPLDMLPHLIYKAGQKAWCQVRRQLDTTLFGQYCIWSGMD